MSDLRAQKKAETRQNISHVATRLFIERGFEAVTIAEVAEAARVAKMTVTNHFPRKEDLVFDVRADFAAWPALFVTREPFVEVRYAYLDALERRHGFIGISSREFVNMIRTSSVLTAALRDMHREREQELTRTLVALDPDGEIVPRASAAYLTAVLRLLFDEAFEQCGDGVDQDRIAAAVAISASAAFTQLAPAFDVEPGKW